ncbi:TetR/AcrR family transcriptional regulator, partial [Nocardioides sp.]|uniref:TetR/AcrR family transcriptional regulator n=1 Tax=Nocardioides sp. TaxID=35761 RepID=UPI0027377AC1
MNARGRRTRSALLAAARQILESDGFDALTMSGLASLAGVTRRAAYLHFESRADVVDALFSHIAETEDLHGSVGRVWAAPDSVAALEEWAQHFTRYHSKVLPVDRAVHRVHHNDPDASQHRRKVLAAKSANCRRIAEWLEREGRLAEPWTVDTATDMLLALATSDVMETLIVYRRWSKRRFA